VSDEAGATAFGAAGCATAGAPSRPHIVARRRRLHPRLDVDPGMNDA
jgi:hypothetical protein